MRGGRVLRALAVAATVVAATQSAPAQDFPARRVTLVVAFSPRRGPST